MKFYIRRAVAGVILSPVVALAYVIGCAVLIGLGAGASFTVGQAWANGFWLGGIVAVLFTFLPQVNKVFEKLGL